jgi:hypothetical protein
MLRLRSHEHPSHPEAVDGSARLHVAPWDLDLRCVRMPSAHRDAGFASRDGVPRSVPTCAEQPREYQGRQCIDERARCHADQHTRDQRADPHLHRARLRKGRPRDIRQHHSAQLRARGGECFPSNAFFERGVEAKERWAAHGVRYHALPTTEREAPTTEGEAPTTEGEALTTEGDALTTEGDALTTEGDALTTEGEALTTEREAVTTERCGAAGWPTAPRRLRRQAWGRFSCSTSS